MWKSAIVSAQIASLWQVGAAQQALEPQTAPAGLFSRDQVARDTRIHSRGHNKSIGKDEKRRALQDEEEFFEDEAFDEEDYGDEEGFDGEEFGEEEYGIEDYGEEDFGEERPSAESCRRAIDRLRNDQADFNEIFKRANEDPDYVFTDETFLFPDSIHWEDVPALQYPLVDDVEVIEWTRISGKFWSEDYTMWGQNYIEPDDAIQGQLGNCWLHVAAMSIAEEPDRIQDLFLVDEKNSAGVYAATMYLLGMPISVVIDDFLPLQYQSWNNEYDTIYAKIGKDKALWGAIFEKVYAKYLGQYEAIDAGLGSQGIEQMTGSPYWQYKHEDVFESDSLDELWQLIVETDAQSMMITSGSYEGSGSDQDTNEVGLPYMHAFSIMYAVEVVDENDESHRLVCIRNPWGRETYFGPWSDSDERWTEDLRAQANHNAKENNNDGKYFMAFEDYVTYMEYTDINLNVSGWHHSSFGFFDDDTPINSQKVFKGDDSEYNVHKLLVYSEEKQKVALSAYTYAFKQYHGACMDPLYQSGSEVFLSMPDNKILQPVWPGSHHEEIIEVDADSTIEVSIYTRFSEDDVMPSDWSLVAWSDSSPVSIYHKDGIEPRSFRNLSPDSSIPIPTDFSPPKEPMRIIDYGMSNPHIYDIEFTHEEFGNFTEKVISKEHDILNHTISIDHLDGNSTSIIMTHYYNEETQELTTYGFASDGSIAEFQCGNPETQDEECAEQKTSNWLITPSVSEDEGERTFIFTLNNKLVRGLNMNIEIMPEYNWWKSTHSFDDDLIFEKTWSYLPYAQAPWNFPFAYEMHHTDSNDTEYHIFERLDMYGGHEDYMFKIVTGDQVYQGNITIVYDDFYNQKLYFGDAEMPCKYDPELDYCQANITDPATGISYFYSSDMSVTNILRTPVVEMHQDFDYATAIYSRTNYFLDGTTSYDEWNIDEEYEKHSGGSSETNSKLKAYDFSGDYEMLYDVVLIDTPWGNFTERIRHADDNEGGQFIQTYEIARDGEVYRLFVRYETLPDGLIITAGSSLNNTEAFFDCFGEEDCAAEQEVGGVWKISTLVYLRDQFVWMNISTSFSEDFFVVQTIDREYQLWTRYAIENDTEVFSKTWEYANSLDEAEFHAPINFVYNQTDDSGMTYYFNETIDVYEWHEVWNYHVQGKEDHSGKVTVLHSSTQVTYFGDQADYCFPLDDVEGDYFYCQNEVRFSDLETGHVFYQNKRSDYSYVETPEVTMYFEFNMDTGTLLRTRTNIFNDGSSSSFEFDLSDEIEKHFNGHNDTDTDTDEEGEVEEYWQPTLETVYSEQGYWEMFLQMDEQNPEESGVEVAFIDNVQNSTTVYTNLRFYNYEIGESHALQMHIRKNDTHRFVNLLEQDLYGGETMTAEIDMSYQPGVETISVSWSSWSFHVNMTWDQNDYFEQTIGYYYVPGLNFTVLMDLNHYANPYLETYIQLGDRSLYNDYYYLQDQGFTGTGPIFEEPETVDMTEEAYNAGYSDGYSQGYGEGSDGKTPSVQVDPEMLQRAASKFSGWLGEQKLESDSFTCGADVRIDVPYPQNKQFSALVANHDCSDRTLLLTVVLDQDVVDNFVGFVGASLTDNGCQDVSVFEGVIACEFEIPPYNSNFGILFKGGFNPVFYQIEWDQDDTWETTFNWW